MLKARIEVKLKKGIVDPEGKNITKALNLLHFKEVVSVKTSKIFEILVNENDEKKAMERAELMCRRLLSNPVINDYNIEIVKMEND